MARDADYSTMTDDEFDAILAEIVSKLTPAQILSYGDVYAILREELNNEILTTWEHRNPKRAFPRRQRKVKTTT